MKNNEIIYIIDDDKSVRNSLSLFLQSVGYEVETFESAEEFLETEKSDGAGCIILDVNMGGKSGLKLQEELIEKGSELPIVFITGKGNIQMSVNAVKKGAVNFLEKPFKEEDILLSVSEAVSLSQNVVSQRAEQKMAQNLVNSLTPRELEILKYLPTGMLNKQIAAELSIAEQTVKIHRRSICDKLGVKSVPEILRIAEKAGVKMTD
ncbi:MAG: response regulator transcription factor [Bacteroidetes bacterium]|nr:MAG: response regulator transcription factor [Bacteroidota bacterium]